MSGSLRNPWPAARLLGVALALALAAAVYRGGNPGVRKITYFDAAPGAAWFSGDFRPLGYVASPTEVPPGLEALGSRVDGRDDFTGTLRSAWYVAQPRVAVLVAGFPRAPKNRLVIEARNAQGEPATNVFAQVNPRDCWRPWVVKLPPDAVVFRVVATDGETAPDTWLGVSEPFVPGLDPTRLGTAGRAFLGFALNLLLYLAAGAALGTALLPRLPRLPPALRPLLAGVTVALAGYAAFGLYFWHPLAGRIFSWALAAGSAGALLWARPATQRALRLARAPVLLAALAGTLYLAMLTLYDPPRLSHAAANRFDPGLPMDNELPRLFAERLWQGESPRPFVGDWLSSDRPPLQTGWVLLTWPVLDALGLDRDTAAATAGMCFQLLWILAAWSLARHLGVPQRGAIALVAAVALNGVMLQYTIYVWPKLGAAALTVAAFLCWREGRTAAHFAIGGVCAALGWLAHGGVAFSILAMAPLALLWRRRIPLRRWVPAAVAFALCAAPWLAYQRLYDPPGNRLLKWHLAGSPGIDARGFLETLRDRYREVGVAGAVEARTANLRMQIGGRWPDGPTLVGDRPGHARRAEETAFLLRSLAAWTLALAVPILWIFRRPRLPAAARRHLPAAAGWLLAGLAAWLALLFPPYGATIHQGTLVTQILAFTLLAACAWHQDRRLFAALALLQGAWFFYAWLPASARVEGSPAPGPARMVAVAAVAFFVLLWRGAGRRRPRPLSSSA